MKDIVDGITILLIFLGMSIPVIIVFLFAFFKKRFEHKQIMAAIEKGIPLSELKPLMTPRHFTPSWIKSLTLGIGLLIFPLPFLFLSLNPVFHNGRIAQRPLLAFVIFLALGTAFFVRGLLLRKYQKEQPSDNSQNNNCSKSGVTE